VSTTGVPGGLPSLMYSDVPDKVHRRRVGRRPHKRRSCRDNRPYVVVPWTIGGDLVAGQYPPYWLADRDYWIAGAHATVDDPPTGDDLAFNLRVTRRTEGVLGTIMTSDTRLRIEPGENEDSLDETRDGILEESHLNIKRLKRGDRVNVVCTNIGSGNPGNHAVVVLELVPYAWPEREFDRED
jgi:hypothetical protein